jgi:hypothetical protein
MRAKSYPAAPNAASPLSAPLEVFLRVLYAPVKWFRHLIYTLQVSDSLCPRSLKIDHGPSKQAAGFLELSNVSAVNAPETIPFQLPPICHIIILQTPLVKAPGHA